MGSGHTLGERGGEEAHTVINSEMPAHIHPAQADARQGNANTDNPNGAYPAYTTGLPLYSSGSNNMVAMSPQMVSSIGGSQPHENRQPFLTLTFCIALQGIFPSQNLTRPLVPKGIVSPPTLPQRIDSIEARPIYRGRLGRVSRRLRRFSRDASAPGCRAAKREAISVSTSDPHGTDDSGSDPR